MKILLTIAVFLLILYPISGLADCQMAQSKTSPDIIQEIAPKTWYYNYNIEQIQRDAETWYVYCYVEIKGKLTKWKVLEAIAAAESSNNTNAIEAIASERTIAKEKLAEITAMSYAQIDQHIDNVFGNLSANQKASLKKLYRAVLALIKQADLD